MRIWSTWPAEHVKRDSVGKVRNLTPEGHISSANTDKEMLVTAFLPVGAIWAVTSFPPALSLERAVGVRE